MARRPTHFGNDHWTIELADLGMLDAGDALARLVLTCRPPYAVCVQGKWGSGKTSLMHYAMARLGGESLTTTLSTARDPVEELPEEDGQRTRRRHRRPAFETPPPR